MSDQPDLRDLADVNIPEFVKEPVDETTLEHRDFEEDGFWRRIPAFAEIDRATFMDPAFQNRHSVNGASKFRALFEGFVQESFLQDVEKGLREAPMNVRITPYLLSRIDWQDPYHDPVRIQFLPVASTRLPDHPHLSLDSLHEQKDSPTPGLVHRYPDKALFLPLDVCPVYCRFCTRSYAVGGSTDTVEKGGYKPQLERWKAAFAYLAARPEIEDVVVSGGDAYMLSASRLREILTVLLAIPHIRRIRIASKGPAVMPMKILTDTAWTETLCELVEQGRKQCKEICLHTHFNCTQEISSISRDAMNLLFQRGVVVRNQSVLIRGVNDSHEAMAKLIKQLSWMNVQPYYVYQHDMVKGVEELRTRLKDSIELERQVRGITAGFNTPTFVTDVPGGGGKRDLHSFEYYDEITGVSVYRSPAVDKEKAYLYFDPIDGLPEEGREQWADRNQHSTIIARALNAAGLNKLSAVSV
ncbi:MAG: KamA family radical SAM protein [Planctomycetota bacterium]|nr:MAG: KamA family radical SAM protein [Planctomycetota bacterium]